MKKIAFIVLAIFAAGVVTVMAIGTASPESALCIGPCRSQAERKFELLYSYFMDVATTCDGPKASRAILEELEPDLATTIDEKNAIFALLATKETNGTLTVQERADYQNDLWRFKPNQESLIYRQMFSDVTQTPESPSVITPCDGNGFHLGPSGYDSYCEDFTQVNVGYNADQGPLRSSPNFFSILDAKNALFERLRQSGELSERLEELRAISIQDDMAQEAAKDEVASSAAHNIATDEVDVATAAKFNELRCQSWATRVITPIN